jgi:hypothetical protein
MNPLKVFGLFCVAVWECTCAYAFAMLPEAHLISIVFGLLFALMGAGMWQAK